MAHVKLKPVVLILCSMIVMIFCACTAADDRRAAAEELFIKDIAFIAADIQDMYDEADARDIHWPVLYIAFADIDFDGIPEFFYGYQTMTALHNKIWYRAYSLKDRAIIEFKHLNSFNTYLHDEECAFFTGPEIFFEGYYLDENAQPCFVTQAITGPVTGMWTDYALIQYINSSLFVTTDFECNKELLEIKQVWSKADLSNIENDIIELLNQYSD